MGANNNGVNKITIVCQTCNSSFLSWPSQKRRVCSRECFRKHHSQFMKAHPNKGQFDSSRKAFLGRRHSGSSKKLMSDKTKQAWSDGRLGGDAMSEAARKRFTGVNNVNWKGGVSKENRTARQNAAQTPEYKQWRTAVFERDNYTCQVCEQHNGVLHADHIERWADNEDLRYAVENGRTVCVACHYYITFKKVMKPGQRWCNFTARKTG